MMINKKINGFSNVEKIKLGSIGNFGGFSKQKLELSNQYAPKISVVSGLYSKSFAFSIIHAIYNTSHVQKILQDNHQYLINNGIHLNINEQKHDGANNMNVELFHVIWQMLLNNFCMQNVQDEDASQAHLACRLFYIPIDYSRDADAYEELLRNHLFKDVDNEFIDVFWQHYNYYEQNLIRFLILGFGFEELVELTSSSDTVKSFNYTTLQTLRNNLNTEFNLLKSLYYPTTDIQRILTDQSVDELFEIAFYTCNSYWLNHILTFNKNDFKNSIYLKLQQHVPEVFAVHLYMQEIIMQWYIYVYQLNLESLIYIPDLYEFETENLIIDFYSTIAMYPNLIQIFNRQLEKLMHSQNDWIKSVNVNNKNEFLNRFENLLNLDKIVHH